MCNDQWQNLMIQPTPKHSVASFSPFICFVISYSDFEYDQLISKVFVNRVLTCQRQSVVSQSVKS